MTRAYNRAPLLRARIDVETEARFWSKVDRSGDCWLWTGAVGKGYGRFGLQAAPGKVTLAHRVSWVLTHGDLAADVLVTQTCHNRLCVRPEHVTTTDYNQVASLRGGLTGEDAAWIRANIAVYTYGEMAALLGVSSQVVSSVNHGRTWRDAAHVPRGPAQHRKVNPAIAERMRAEWDDGDHTSLVELAVAFDVAMSTAWMVVNQAHSRGNHRTGPRRIERNAHATTHP